jgi:hypothetical protein
MDRSTHEVKNLPGLLHFERLCTPEEVHGNSFEKSNEAGKVGAFQH